MDQNFILVSTDSDFESLVGQISGAKIVILRACNYSTDIAAQVIRRNAIRIVALSTAKGLIVLDQ